MVVDFDLGVGFEVVRQQHDGNRHLVQIIDLKHRTETRHQTFKGHIRVRESLLSRAFSVLYDSTSFGLD